MSKQRFDDDVLETSIVLRRSREDVLGSGGESIAIPVDSTSALEPGYGKAAETGHVILDGKLVDLGVHQKLRRRFVQRVWPIDLAGGAYEVAAVDATLGTAYVMRTQCDCAGSHAIVDAVAGVRKAGL